MRRQGVAQLRRLGPLFLDFFSGVGGVAKTWRKLGGTAREIDIIHGFELLSRKLQTDMLRLIRRKRVKAIIMGTPCTSFSIARDRTAVIRNLEFPWGFPILQKRTLKRSESEMNLLVSPSRSSKLRAISAFPYHREPVQFKALEVPTISTPRKSTVA